MTRFVSEILGQHERAAFASGIDRIDRYFRETVSQDVKRSYAAHAICADAIDEAAAAFYRDHQFQPLVSRPRSLFLPMKTALALVGSCGRPATSAQS